MSRLLLAILLTLCLASPGWAAVGFGTIGTGAAGTTTLSVPLPASIADGDLLVLCIANKYPANAPTTPSGWTFDTNARGTADTGDGPANDLGATYISMYYKVASSESGNLAITITGGNSSYGFMARYTNATQQWLAAGANGGDSTSGTSWSAAVTPDPGITGGDMVVACSARNSTAGAASSEAFAATGLTMGTAAERGDNGTSFGDDVGIVFSDHVVTSGTYAPGTATVTFTNATNTGGGTAILRIREDNAAATTIQSNSGFLGAIIK